MDTSILINCFYDTLDMCNSPKLYSATEKAKEATKIYKKDFESNKAYGRFKAECIATAESFAEIIVKEGTTFAAAKEYIKYGKTAVLSFANPHNAGGGVRNGAMAQEECLCRSSNLYPCLLTENAQEEYYHYNKTNTDYFFSDRIIYSEGITVFKNDNEVPAIMPEKEWFHVSVITCAAPYIAERRYTNRAALKELFKKRIKNIFEVALDNNIQILVLGAFGCGAFKNPPELVASAFYEVINENEYRKWFDKIIFAIKNIGNPALPAACPNLTAFADVFCGISKEEYEGEEKNKHKRKQFSILGDSISTLEGFNPQGYKVFYTGENCNQSGVYEMKDTWWGKVIDFFGGELLVNNSWSGSRVAKIPDSSQLFPSGCSDERTAKLHINNVFPDVIIIYLGINDWCFGINSENKKNSKNQLECFDAAYDTMLAKLKTNYPNAEIWCCTLNSTFMSNNPSFVFPEVYNGNNINNYNKMIHDIAEKQKCKLIDLYYDKIPYDSIDGTHPNINGMRRLASKIIRLIDRYGSSKIKESVNIMLGRYKILRQIPAGTFTETYLVQDFSFNLYLMKVYDKANNINILIQETVQIAVLNHYMIPKIIDIIDDDEKLYIIREYFQGENLCNIIKTSGPQPFGQVIDWAKQICDVLQYLHTLNPPRIHRDIKPSNMILQPNGQLKLIEFGTMKTYKPNQSRDTVILGTVGYAAPEQFKVNPFVKTKFFKF